MDITRTVNIQTGDAMVSVQRMVNLIPLMYLLEVKFIIAHIAQTECSFYRLWRLLLCGTLYAFPP